MFIEPTITWVPSGSLGTYGLTQKLCLKKKKTRIQAEVSIINNRKLSSVKGKQTYLLPV